MDICSHFWLDLFFTNIDRTMNHVPALKTAGLAAGCRHRDFQRLADDLVGFIIFNAKLRSAFFFGTDRASRICSRLGGHFVAVAAAVLFMPRALPKPERGGGGGGAGGGGGGGGGAVHAAGSAEAGRGRRRRRCRRWWWRRRRRRTSRRRGCGGKGTNVMGLMGS